MSVNSEITGIIENLKKRKDGIDKILHEINL